MADGGMLGRVGENQQLLIAHVPHARAVGLSVEKAERGKAWIKVPWSEDLVGNPETGVIHGGVITTLLDNCCGVAVMAALDDFRSIATLDLRIDYMKPATPKIDVIGYCHCYKVTRNVAFVRGVAYHETPEDPIASAVATFMLGPNQTPPTVADTTGER